MTALVIDSEISGFNRHAWNLSWIYGGLALGAWCLSFAILTALIGVPLLQMGVPIAKWLLLLVVSLAMVVLAWEGTRHARRLFDLDDYRNSFYSFNLAGPGERQHATNLMASPVLTPSALIATELGVAYLISQTLFSAPWLSARPFVESRRRVRLSAAEKVQAQEFVDFLGGNGGPWVHVADHRSTRASCPSSSRWVSRNREWKDIGSRFA